jgi:hypothetical protein
MMRSNKAHESGCECYAPLREVRATRKGAAHTYCARGDRLVRLELFRPLQWAIVPPKPDDAARPAIKQSTDGKPTVTTGEKRRCLTRRYERQARNSPAAKCRSACSRTSSELRMGRSTSARTRVELHDRLGRIR